MLPMKFLLVHPSGSRIPSTATAFEHTNSERLIGLLLAAMHGKPPCR